ncbi:hypothetical protein Vafri_2137, partial [Volvox africanus]
GRGKAQPRLVGPAGEECHPVTLTYGKQNVASRRKWIVITLYSTVCIRKLLSLRPVTAAVAAAAFSSSNAATEKSDKVAVHVWKVARPSLQGLLNPCRQGAHHAPPRSSISDLTTAAMGYFCDSSRLGHIPGIYQHDRGVVSGVPNDPGGRNRSRRGERICRRIKNRAMATCCNQVGIHGRGCA